MATVFRVRGGIHPDYCKDLTCEKAIVALPMPALLTIPLQQHVGAPAQLLVSAGERVRKG
ncbi:MAG: electron transporter RnfC, partial [Pseudomonadota bacterium]